MQKNANETAKETKNMFLQSAKELKAVTTLAACAMFAALAMILNQVASIDIGHLCPHRIFRNPEPPCRLPVRTSDRMSFLRHS